MQRRLNNSDSLRLRLRDAAQELILTQGIDALSVSTITRHAGISRTTFYLIYGSKDELLHDICDNFLAAYLEQFIKSQTDNKAEQKNIVVQTFNILKRHERLLRAIWNIRSENFHPYLTMKDSIYRLVRRYTSKRHGRPENDSALELFSRYYAANTMETIRWWLDHHGQVEPEYLYRLIMACLEKGMFYVLETDSKNA